MPDDHLNWDFELYTLTDTVSPTSKDLGFAPCLRLYCFSAYDSTVLSVIGLGGKRRSNVDRILRPMKSSGGLLPAIVLLGVARYVARNDSSCSDGGPPPSNFLSARLKVATNRSACPFD